MHFSSRGFLGFLNKKNWQKFELILKAVFPGEWPVVDVLLLFVCFGCRIRTCTSVIFSPTLLPAVMFFLCWFLHFFWLKRRWSFGVSFLRYLQITCFRSVRYCFAPVWRFWLPDYYFCPCYVFPHTITGIWCWVFLLYLCLFCSFFDQ